jgi:hypothetical protein
LILTSRLECDGPYKLYCDRFYCDTRPRFGLDSAKCLASVKHASFTEIVFYIRNRNLDAGKRLTLNWLSCPEWRLLLCAASSHVIDTVQYTRIDHHVSFLWIV